MKVSINIFIYSYLYNVYFQYFLLTKLSTPIFLIVLDVKKDVDATYYESSDGSDKMDQNMIQNLIEESEAARKMMSSTRASSQSRQVGHIYSYDSENVKKSIKPQNTNERLQINNRRKTEVESSVEVSHILKGHHLLSDKNVVALKLCLKEFDLSSNELSNGEKDDQHESDGENKNNQTKTKIKTKSPTPTEKVAKKEKIYLTNDMINEIIKIMPQTYADLPAALQKENLRTQHRLLISLHNFLEQYDILHLFPTLNAINTPEMWCLVYARRHTELRILLKCGNENANENENENENENDDKDQINKDCKDKNTNGIVIRHRLNQRREKEDNHAIDKNESKMMKVFKTGNSIESENSLISDRPVRSRFNNASSSSSSSSSSFSSSFAPSTSLSSLSAQGTNGKNDGGVMILVNGVWSPTTNRKRDQHGKIKTPDGLADFDKSNIQAASIVDANDRDEDSKCIGSNIDKKSKKNLVGVLDCSISEGVRIVADTVTMTGVETGTEIMIMVGKQISGCTEEEIEEQKEKEKEKEKEIVKGNEKKTSAGSRLKEGLGLSLGVESVTRGKTVSKGDRGALDVENIHINLRQPFRSTTMFSKNSMHAPAGPIPSAAAVPSTASSSSSSSSSASSSLRSSSSSSSTAAAAAAAAPSSSSRTAAASLSSSSSSSSSGGMMRRGLTEINPPKGPPSHADSTLQRRNTVAGSVRTRTGTPTGTGLSRGISTDMKSRTEIGKDSGKHVAKCVEIVRKKSERESLPGHKCTECAAFYGALQQQGIVSEDGMEEMLQRCSRHKVRYLGFVTDITECTVQVMF